MTPETLWVFVKTDPVPITLVALFVSVVSIGAYWVVRRFMTKNFWVSAGGLVLLSLGVAYHSVLVFSILSGWLFFALVSWGLVLNLGHRLCWGREKDLPPRQRHLLLVMICLSLAGNVIWAWTIISADARVWVFGHDPKFDSLGPEMIRAKVALAAYQIDYGIYPAAVDREGRIVPFSDTGSGVSAGYLPWRLTTPLAYVDRLPLDPYSARRKGDRTPYRYATDGNIGYIIASNGPDRDADIPLADYFNEEKGGRWLDNFVPRDGFPNAVIYDPSNGFLTSGDIVRTYSY